MTDFAPMAGAVTVSAGATSASAAIVMPPAANAMHVCNTSATLYVTVALGATAPTAVLGGERITLPPMGHMVIEANPNTAFVAAIGSAVGPTAVVFTPGRVLA